MTNPIKNNQPPPSDPYTKNYGSDPYANAYGGGPTGPTGPTGQPEGTYPTGGDYPAEGNYPDDNYGMDDPFGQESGDMFVEGDPNQSQGAPQGELSATGLRDMAAQMKEQLGDQYAGIWQKINTAAGMPPGPAQQEAFAAIATKMNELAYPPDMAGVDGADSAEAEEDAGAKELQTKLEDYKKAIESNGDLSSEQKTEFTDKLDKWISGLKDGLLTTDNVEEMLSTLQEDVSEATAYPTSFKSLSEVTGKSPEELESLFQKHGIDPKNPPNPPDKALAALLSDPEFSDKIAGLTKDVAADAKDLKKFVDDNTSNANNLNSSNIQSNTSDVDNLDTSAFKNLNDASTHSDDISKKLIDDRNKVATEIASVLSAMYGTDVKAVVSDDPNKSGFITLGGSELNVIGSNVTANVDFSSNPPDFPAVEKVSYSYDGEGSGQTKPPAWMKDAGYPHNAYDGDDEGTWEGTS